jgi:hypothetical protein
MDATSHPALKPVANMDTPPEVWACIALAILLVYWAFGTFNVFRR